MEKIIATRINHAMETESLLPRLHIGGRRARSPEHALHLLLEAIHAAWLNNEVATVLILDISGAYDNVSHKRLLHNLRKRRIGGNIAKWIEASSGKENDHRHAQLHLATIHHELWSPSRIPYISYSLSLLQRRPYGRGRAQKDELRLSRNRFAPSRLS